MIHVIWIAVCLVGWGSLAGCWLIDKRKAATFMDAQSEVIDDQGAEVVRLRDVNGELKRSLDALDDWGRPLVFGDMARDPLCVTIRLVSDTRFCLTVIKAMPIRRRQIEVRHVAWSPSPLTRWNETELLLSIGKAGTKAKIGVEHLEIITDAVRRYNELFHQSKGVEDADHDQEARGEDRDSGAESSGRRDDRGPRSARQACAARGGSPQERCDSSS